MKKRFFLKKYRVGNINRKWLFAPVVVNLFKHIGSNRLFWIILPILFFPSNRIFFVKLGTPEVEAIRARRTCQPTCESDEHSLIITYRAAPTRTIKASCGRVADGEGPAGRVSSAPLGAERGKSRQ